ADAIAVDAQGNAYVRGVTRSPDFPTTPGAFDTTFNGGFDAYVAKVSVDGSTLVYSTFIGGTGFDSGSGIAVDPTGEAYITGITGSPDFPTTPGAYDTTFTGTGGPRPPFMGGDFDAYVTKLAADGSRLEYSTFLGGGGLDAGFGIAVDPSGNAYVVGATRSPDFPTTAGAYDTTINAPPDAFLTSLTADGTALRYSTFLGGSGFDDALGVALTPRGDAYVTGGTESPDFPTTAGASDTTFNGDRDAYVTRFAPDGSRLTWSTFLGGAGHDYGGGVAVNPRGDAFVTGTTASVDFPTTPGAFDTTFNGGTDAFAVQLHRTTGSLGHSTFLGGAGEDEGADIAVTPRGDAFVTGTTASVDFPTTPGAFDTTFNGGTDAFVVNLERRGGRGRG
ncbi:MAG TPA: SBBP repeat-containing protein, partial [Acidimicrobiales bacterium]|nr:SBBP repeat-containing protein [Acidimicrobiales bacterium]